MKKLVFSFGGVGLVPGIPGTYASLAAAAIYCLLWWRSGDAVRPFVAGLTVLTAAVALVAWDWSVDVYHAQDARQFVLDEVVGQWLALLCVPLGEHTFSYALAAFFLFRGFDVAKPWPVRSLERLHGKWGVLADDVAAGAYAAGAFWALLFLTGKLAGV